MNRVLIAFFCFSFIAFSCGNDDDGDSTGDNFDRTAYLRHTGEQIILPIYQHLSTEVDELKTAADNFADQATVANLTNLKNSFVDAYTAWQKASPFEFGPAEDQLLRVNLNTFPTDAGKIGDNISNSIFVLTSANQLDAKGFPALDYILYGMGTDDNDLVQLFTTDGLAVNRQAYLKAVVQDIKDRVDDTYLGWQKLGGNYIEEFVGANGTDVGSSLGSLVNQLNFDYELLKNAKLAIPLGIKTLGVAIPENVEAYYSGISIDLLKTHFECIRDIYRGVGHDGTDGVGLDDYLNAVDAAHGSGTLDEAIETQIASIWDQMNALPNQPLSDLIINQPQPVDNTHTEVQKLVVLLKTDLPSALGVLITYQDNDGD